MNSTDSKNPKKKHNRSWIWTALRLLGIPFIVYVLLKVDWNDIFMMYDRLGPGTILLMLLGLVLILIVKVFRWSLLLSFQGVPRPFREVFASYTESYFYGFITPARAGEAYRFRHLTEWGLNPRRAVGNLVLERGMDVLVLACFGLFSICLYVSYPETVGVWYGLTVMILVLAAGWFLLWRVHFVRSWISRVDGDLGNQSTLVWCMLQTFLSWGILYLIIYLVRGVLHIQMDPAMTLFSFVLSTAVTAVPVSVAGFGTKELALMHFLGTWGYTPEEAVAFSLIFAVVFVLNLLFSGLIWFAILANQRFGQSHHG